jgi:hypothetical protein
MLADGIDSAIKTGKIADFPVEYESLDDYFQDYTVDDIFEDLNYLNAYALKERYGDTIEENIYSEGMIHNIPEYSIDEYLKMLDCFHYQCCEGNTTKRKLFRVIEEMQEVIGKYVKKDGNPVYESASWG